MKNWRKVSTIQEDTALISPRMSNGIFVFLETTETTVANAVLFISSVTRDHQRTPRAVCKRKKTYKKILKIFLSLPRRLRSEKFFNPSFHKFRVFYLFFFTKEKKTLWALRRRNIHTCFHLLIDGSSEQAKEKRKAWLKSGETLRKKMKMVFRVSRESKRRSGKKNIIAINNSSLFFNIGGERSRRCVLHQIIFMCEISHSDRSFVGADQFSIVYFRNSRSKIEREGKGKQKFKIFLRRDDKEHS
jgi:hypothetical protein